MKSRPSFTTALILLISLASVCVGAQEFQIDGLPNEPWVKEVICRDNPNREAVGWIGDQEIRLCFQFDEKMLQPTSDGTKNDIEFFILSYMKKGAKNLTDLNIVPVSPEDNPGLIIGKAEAVGPERSSTLSSMRAFKVAIQLTPQALSKKYPIVAVATSGTAQQRITFRFPILAPATPSIEVEKQPGAVVDCWAGSDCAPFEVVVRNKLPYKITITNITILSTDLLNNQPNGQYAREIDNGSAPLDLSVLMKAKRITFRRVFSGFGTPQVSMRIDYKDEFGRPLFTQTTADLQIKPNVLVISIFLILGAAVGTFVRFDLGGLERRGIITRRQRIKVAITTFASGIAVCLIALFINLKLIVLTDQNSLSAWDPKVLFVTAVLATVNGLPMLYTYLKVLRQSDANAPQSGNNAKNL